MTIYYVDPYLGSDSNSGTSEGSPIKSPNKSGVIAGLNPGDSLLFKRGTSWTGTVELWRCAAGGTSSARITVGAYGSGALPIINAADTARCLDLAGGTSGYWTIEYLELTGATEAFIKNGSSATTGNITVQYCFCHDTSSAAGNKDGVYLFGPANRILYNTIEDIGNDAIFMAKGSASDALFVEVGYNTIRRISSAGTNGDGVQLSGEVGGAWIHHNIIDHSDSDSKQCIIQSGTASTIPAFFEDNILIGPNTNSTATHKPIYTEMPTYVRRNRITGGIIAIDLGGSGSQAIGNIIDQAVGTTDTSGIRLGATNQIVVGNTIIGSASQFNTTVGINHFNSGHTGCSIRNNIVVGYKYGIRHHPTATVTESHNRIYNCTDDVVDNSYVSQASGTETNNDNPRLDLNNIPQNIDFRNAGVFLGYSDFNNKAFSNTPTIGAIQYFPVKGTTTRTTTTRTATTRTIKQKYPVKG